MRPALEQKLIGMVRSSPRLMAALVAVRSLGLSSWCIGAGAVRSLVWDALHGFDAPSKLQDVDVVHFTSEAAGPVSDADLERRLRTLMPAVQWEVTNQATVHHWFARSLGQVVPALASLEEGVATWPEFATCVGVYLNEDESIGVVAPHGLGDLFGLRVRHNPLRASFAVFRQRVESKRFSERWPLLSIDENP
ncbi:nucleotidyltransferase family protein [Acidovorax sp. ACV02]|uniref:nucleotidyltransferase family protein n=1 Tax=Acidovorax sp. ACV02 TaxID=2769310 RepID=UPI00351C8C22